MTSALIVFAKVPRPGTVKTRLTPPLSDGEAAGLYESFLQDALEAYQTVGADVHLFLNDDIEYGEAFPYLDNYELQVGSGLGEKMFRAFESLFAKGYERVCIVGTDHPTLPMGNIRMAFEKLVQHDTVIGPSHDGGYYLFGMRSLFRAPFQEMTYSHSAVFSDTLTRIQSAKLTTFILPEWYDVDDVASLAILCRDLENTEGGCRHTRDAARVLKDKYLDIIEDQFDEIKTR